MQDTDELLKKIEDRFEGMTDLKGKSRVILDQNHKLFFISPHLLKIYDKIKKIVKPYAAGFYFGEVNEEIMPSLGSAFKYAKKHSSKTVVINKRFEQKFLFGRNVNSKNILDLDTKIKKDDLVIICNEHKEALGLGKALVDFNIMPKETTVIKNILDAGMYIRKK